MSATLTRDESSAVVTPRRPMPVLLPWGVGAGALALSALLLGVVAGAGPVIVVIVAVPLFAVAMNLVSRQIEGRRRATDRTVTTIVGTAFVIALIPLISLLYTVVTEGAARFDGEFFSNTMRGVVGDNFPGGARHAIYGTLIITGLATLISVPVGLLTSIYLVEYGRGRLARTVTFLVDVMTGIPSIVAGLFAYALFELIVGPGVRFGIGGAVALSVLMIPVVVRSSEEMLKLVPAELREASYALGVPKWKTILRIVLPVAAAGIMTGVTLAVARVIGETAPLLLIVGTTVGLNLNPFSGRMETLPIFIFYQYTQPGVPRQVSIDRAWTAALVLLLIVLLLNVTARLVAKFFAPKGSR
ncbi:MAG: phosphate transporter permease [Frankiales bacterium]|nr:phosphate transporter permease [Frankiales bacterium]